MTVLFAQFDTSLGWKDVVAFTAIAITCATFVWNAKVQWFLKSSDTRLEFQKRYDQLVLDMGEAKDTQVLDRQYYRRYWGLQKEQFDCWMDGWTNP